MDKDIIQLAIILLQEYSGSLASNGCNDPSGEVEELINKIGYKKFRTMADNVADSDEPEQYDFIIVDTVASELKKLL